MNVEICLTEDGNHEFVTVETSRLESAITEGKLYRCVICCDYDDGVPTYHPSIAGDEQRDALGMLIDLLDAEL